MFCTSNGSKIDHLKIGFWVYEGFLPDVVVKNDSKQLFNGEIFRLVATPMGFGIFPKDRWQCIYNKVISKFKKWIEYQHNLSSLIAVLNLYILYANV